jgi:hypothetical protein
MDKKILAIILAVALIVTVSAGAYSYTHLGVRPKQSAITLSFGNPVVSYSDPNDAADNTYSITVTNIGTQTLSNFTISNIRTSYNPPLNSTTVTVITQIGGPFIVYTTIGGPYTLTPNSSITFDDSTGYTLNIGGGVNIGGQPLVQPYVVGVNGTYYPVNYGYGVNGNAAECNIPIR